MAGIINTTNQRDFIRILQEIRGTGAPGDDPNSGIWFELAFADYRGNQGMYNDILEMYTSFVTDNSDFEPKYADFVIKYGDFAPKYDDFKIKYLIVDGVNFDMRVEHSIEKIPMLVVIGVTEDNKKVFLTIRKRSINRTCH